MSCGGSVVVVAVYLNSLRSYVHSVMDCLTIYTGQYRVCITTSITQDRLCRVRYSGDTIHTGVTFGTS